MASFEWAIIQTFSFLTERRRQQDKALIFIIRFPAIYKKNFLILRTPLALYLLPPCAFRTILPV